MFGGMALRMNRRRELALAARPNNGARRPLTVAKLPLTCRTISVAPDDASYDSAVAPFVAVTRRSGVTITAVRDGDGNRLVRKDFPDYDRGLAECRIACYLSDDDRACGCNSFVKVVGTCLSTFQGGFAICFGRYLCSYAQYMLSPMLFAPALGEVAARPSALLDNVITGMDQMHRLGWAHNDIKPDNVLLELRDGVVNFVLCDYGLTARSDLLSFARGTDGYRFPWPETRLIGRHSDYWAVGLFSAEIMCDKPFLAPWDLATLGQATTDQCAVDNFVLCKFRAYGVAQMATPLRRVFIREPSSTTIGLDPRCAHESLQIVVSFLARREAQSVVDPAAGPRPRPKRARDADVPAAPQSVPAAASAPAPVQPPAVSASLPDVVPAPPVVHAPQHVLLRSKARKRHMRRDAARKRWKAQQAQPMHDANVTYSVGQAHVLPHFDPKQPGDPEQNQQGPGAHSAPIVPPGSTLAPVVSPLSDIVQTDDPNWFYEVFENDPGSSIWVRT